ncbi:hypothetical protein GCK72_004433 [Caenorhabditis remanei]|uniref:Serine/threonine-protein phosphatase n=1 Tax=Caenorhabditis remanei TaxID=31234 RepID=A0A6A5HB81_CAERE|nr:hypothetical protein GCK72_004433 [Caenorhabditis remanei]KAF1764485.1 hypothetical protein GCK72_004433 [Caenorhabditis remanei]
MLLLRYFLTSLAFQIGNAILCHQCEGWRGHKEGGLENSCWKYNNNCETNVFCVKITEPMTREATYEPYRSECWHQNNLVVAPGNSTIVQNGCYTFFDQATPPKRKRRFFTDDDVMSRSPGDGKVALKKQLTSVSKDLAIHGIHVDLLAIRQEVRSGRLQWKTVVAELLDLNKRNMDALENGSLGGLAESLEGLVTLVGKACGDKGVNCGGLDKITTGITAMETIDSTALNGIEATVKAGSSHQVLLKVKQSDPQKLQKALTRFKGYIQNPPSNTADTRTMDEYRNSIKYDPLDLIAGSKMFSTEFTPEEINALSETSMKNATNGVLMAKPVCDLKGKGGKLDLMKGQLTLLTKATTDLLTHFSDDRLKSIREKIGNLSQTMDRPKLGFDEKTATHGFPGGFEDLKNVPVNVKSSFVKDSGTNEQGEKILKELVTFASVLEKEVEPFLKVSHPDGAAEVIQLAEKLTEQLKLARSEISELGGFSELQKCAEIIDGFAQAVKMELWESEKPFITQMGNDAKLFAEAFNKITVTTTEIEKFGKAVENIDLNKQTDFVSTYAQKDALLAELGSLEANLAQITPKPSVTAWTAMSKIDVLLQSLNDYLQKNGLRPLQNCFTTGGILEAAKKSIGDRSTMSAVLDINSGNKNYAGALGLEKFALDFSNAWKQKIAANTAIQITGDVPMLPDSLKVSHDANAAIKYLRDLAAVAEEQFNLEEFQKNEKAILASFDTLKVAPKQEYTALLTDEMLRIKNLLKFLDEANQIVIKVPHHLSDYKEVFSALGNLSGLSKHQLSELMDACVQSGSPFPSKKVLDRLKKLDLDFSNGQTVMKNGLVAFNSTIPYFVEPVSNMVSIAPNQTSATTSAPDESSKAAIYAGVGIGAGCVAAAVAGGVFYRNKKQAERDEEVLSKLRAVGNGDEADMLMLLEDDNVLDDCDRYVGATVEGVDDIPVKNRWSGHQMASVGREMLRLQKEQDEVQVGYNMLPVGIDENNKPPYRFPYISETDVATMRLFPVPEVTVSNDKCTPVFHPCEKEYSVGKGKDMFESERREAENKVEDSVEVSKEKQKRKADADKSTKRVDNSFKKHLDVYTENKKREPAGTDGQPSNSKEKDIESQTGGIFGCCRSEKKENEKKDYNLLTEETYADKLERALESAVPDYNFHNYDAYLKMYRHKPSGRPWAIPLVGDPVETAVENRLRCDDNHNHAADRLGSNNFRTTGENGQLELNVDKLIFCMLGKKFIEYDYAALNLDKPLPKISYHFRPDELEWIIKKAMEQFARDREQGHPIILLRREKIVVVGDIHGKYRDFCYALTSHFMNDKVTFVFLGDFVDRGPRSMDVVLLMCLLKIAHPRRFYWIRGNHETPATNMSYGYLTECRSNLGHWYGTDFWKNSNDLFKTLPLCAILQNKVFAAHGGIPRKVESRNHLISFLREQPRTKEEVVFQNHFLWADPSVKLSMDPKKPTAFIIGGGRGTPGVEDFTAVGIKYVLGLIGCQIMVRGHEVKEEGIKFFAGTTVATVFSSTNNTNRNKAAHIIIDHDLNINIVKFHNKVEGTMNDEKTERPHNPRKKKSKSR